MKLLRTIRFDSSDTFVFEKAAEPGEWAVSGAFAFWAGNPAELAGKARAAFRGGFLGVHSLGWSTLAQIVAATETDRENLIATLAEKLMQQFGAPDIAAARAAAEEEVAFTQSLCAEPQDTLIAVHRTCEDGHVRESFRSLRMRSGPRPFRAFSFLETEGDDEPGDGLDLLALAERGRR